MVPIFRFTRDYTCKTYPCERTQFPLATAYAITVHKSQGITVDRAVLDISHKEFSPGLTYVAVSRVKSLTGLMFVAPFDLEKLRRAQGKSAKWRMEDWVKRTAEVIPLS
jgi:ATP-dependent DNA helicase PIF1